MNRNTIKKEKVSFFEKNILDFWKKSGRHELPWRVPRGKALSGRKDISAYEVWVSEIMLQQTQVSRVIGYYERFLKKFPTVEKLAKANWSEFLPYYEGLGYYSRGRNMLKTAKLVVGQHGGVFPKSKEELMRLPGIGEYTASAILSFAYGSTHLAWDTNLKRVVGRFFYGSKQEVIDKEALEKKFKSPAKKMNAALMDFGSSICTARPKCSNCPLAKQCAYFKTQGRKEKGALFVPARFPTQEAQVYLFLHENHRQYYSDNSKRFAPFILPATYNTRAAIKEYFLKKYGLRLAVRPPHAKLWKDGIPILLVRAQILLGTPTFTIFPSSAVKEYTP